MRFSVHHGKDLKLSSVQEKIQQGGWERADTQTEYLSYTVQRSACVLLPSFITNVSISIFSLIVLSFIYSYIMNRTDFLLADGGLFLHPAT